LTEIFSEGARRRAVDDDGIVVERCGVVVTTGRST